MPNDRAAVTYTRDKLLRGGGSVKVTLCIKDNSEMTAQVWTQDKGGILYTVWGVRCPECGAYVENHYELLGPAKPASSD